MDNNRRFQLYFWGGWGLLGLVVLLLWVSPVMAQPAVFTRITHPNADQKLLLLPGQTFLSQLTGPVMITSTATFSAANLDPFQPYTLDDFVAQFNFGPEVKPEWIYSTPEQVTKFEVRLEHQARADQYGYRANYYWNDYLSDDYFLTSGLFRAIPLEISTYRPAWQTVFPRFRYPPNVTLPTGLTTNQFGWRGPQIELHKPSEVIRIACVGASTTVDTHSLFYPYPEFLQHWLNLWATENNYPVRFEVINAGREGIGSRDIAAIVRYEVLPLDVDYIIYYEGANQFVPSTMINYAPDIVFGQPPPGLVPNFSNIESSDKTLLDTLSEYSALADRARSLWEQLMLSGEEPPKPEQTFNLPEGADEFNPDREHLGQALGLKAILNDLDQIKQDLDENQVKLLLGTFDWFAYDGMVMNPAEHRNLYGYLNRVYWPITYANIRRMADFQNRVLTQWATQNNVPLIDIAGQMPRHPDLYDDAIHNTQLGIRIRAWLNFEALVPRLKEDITSKRLPHPPRFSYQTHPYLESEFYTRSLPVN
jgi:hypothetical protein